MLRVGVRIALLTLISLNQTAHARELFGRTGLGYNAQFANTNLTNGVPAISIKYGLAPRAAIQAIAGFYSGGDGSGVAALKYLQTIRGENYANFYYTFGLGTVSALQRNGTQFLLGIGAEFFIPGVDSVGFSFESGVTAESLTSTSQSFILKTYGVSFIHAGMHYYF